MRSNVPSPAPVAAEEGAEGLGNEWGEGPIGACALSDEGLEVGGEVLMERATLGAAGTVLRGLHRRAPARVMRWERFARWVPALFLVFKGLCLCRFIDD